MVEQNPLRKVAICSNSNGNFNKKGRPPKGNVVCFGPQPQSMVSILLNQLKADCNNQLLTEKRVVAENKSIASTPACTSESDQTQNAIKRGIKTKDKPKTYSCDFENCSYSTKLTSNMTKHMRVHTGEKPYLCDRCSFRSNFINSLKCHKRLHTEVRPYKCSECNYSCNSISNLKKHCHTRHKTYQIVEKVG